MNDKAMRWVLGVSWFRDSVSGVGERISLEEGRASAQRHTEGHGELRAGDRKPLVEPKTPGGQADQAGKQAGPRQVLQRHLN